MIPVRSNEWMGWRPDTPDVRDHCFSLRSFGRKLMLPKRPRSVDLSGGIGPCYNQKSLGSCTAHGIAALIEYERRFNKLPLWMPSRLQIYYNERFMEGTVKSDAGAEIRDGIKVVAKLGYAPETMWPYQTSKFRLAPSLTAQREAKKHLVKAYARVPQTQEAILDCLASNTPFTFGFTVYDYFESDEMASTGKLRMPKSGEGTNGGHAVAAFGYLNEETILVRNSWDTDWGLKGKHAGYFTMPIAYMLDPNLSDDFWCLKIVE